MYGDEFAAKEMLKDCSFGIEEGQFTVLIGPSGCGKTTLINMIAGYEQVSAGHITCDGKQIVGPTRDRLVLFQETALFPWMTVFENVMYGPTVRAAGPQLRQTPLAYFLGSDCRISAINTPISFQEACSDAPNSLAH